MNRFIDFLAFGDIFNYAQKINIESEPKGTGFKNKGDFIDSNFNNRGVKFSRI